MAKLQMADTFCVPMAHLTVRLHLKCGMGPRVLPSHSSHLHNDADTCHLSLIRPSFEWTPVCGARAQECRGASDDTLLSSAPRLPHPMAQPLENQKQAWPLEPVRLRSSLPTAALDGIGHQGSNGRGWGTGPPHGFCSESTALRCRARGWGRSSGELAATTPLAVGSQVR